MGKQPKNFVARFQPGVSGNPNGKPRLPSYLKQVPLISLDELKRHICKHFRLTLPQLEMILSDTESEAIDLILASAIKRAITTGDVAKVEFLFNRVFGKVKDVVETTLTVNPLRKELEQMTTDELLRIATELEPFALEEG